MAALGNNRLTQTQWAALIWLLVSPSKCQFLEGPNHIAPGPSTYIVGGQNDVGTIRIIRLQNANLTVILINRNIDANYDVIDDSVALLILSPPSDGQEQIPVLHYWFANP